MIVIFFNYKPEIDQVKQNKIISEIVEPNNNGYFWKYMKIKKD